MLCKDVMMSLVFECKKDVPVEQCAQVMRDEHIGFIPITGADGNLVGVVTDRDLVLRVMAAQKPLSTPVGDIMSSGPLLTCAPDEDLRDLEKRMSQERRSRAVVMEKDKVVGVISLSDIAQAERSSSRAGKLLRDVTHRESALIARP